MTVEQMLKECQEAIDMDPELAKLKIVLSVNGQDEYIEIGNNTMYARVTGTKTDPDSPNPNVLIFF
jgi:hypothetical protein